MKGRIQNKETEGALVQNLLCSFFGTSASDDDLSTGTVTGETGARKCPAPKAAHTTAEIGQVAAGLNTQIHTLLRFSQQCCMFICTKHIELSRLLQRLLACKNLGGNTMASQKCYATTVTRWGWLLAVPLLGLVLHQPSPVHET